MHKALEALPRASGTQLSWFHHAEQILALLDQHRPRVTVELGTWRGASAIAMARVVREWGGSVTCVDTWMGDVNGGLAPGLPGMLLEAAGYMITCGVAASIRLIPALTLDAAAHWSGPIDFLYVDADHSYDSVAADLRAWWPHVRSGGLVAGDDYRNPMYPGVTQAWDDFEGRHGLSLARVETPQTPEELRRLGLEGTPTGMALVYGVKP